jgi:hypothetical protein
MSLASVPAIYDGENIRLLEKTPADEPYRVLVTFLEPVREQEPDVRARFLRSFGAWRDDRPIKGTLRDIHEARRSKAEPLAL